LAGSEDSIGLSHSSKTGARRGRSVAAMTNPIPSGFHTLTPALVVDGAAAALDFYERAFGAQVTLRLSMGDLVAHSEVRIGDSMVYVNDPLPDFGLVAPGGQARWSTALTIYCEDPDAMHAGALAAGATQITPVGDQFHGDRLGTVCDPFGHRWIIAARIEEMSAEEMQRRLDEWLAAGAPH
jgi:PhnB protein